MTVHRAAFIQVIPCDSLMATIWSTPFTTSNFVHSLAIS